MAVGIGSDPMGNPIVVGVDPEPSAPNTTPLSDILRDNTSDVPGRPDQQNTMDLFFSGPLLEVGTGSEDQRDASTNPPKQVVTRDAGSEGQQGILGRMWNVIAHPLQTIEDTGKSAGKSVGGAVGEAVSGVLKSLLPLIIIVLAVFLIGLYIVAQRATIRANV